ncbi:MAG: gamma-glutamylcyclotransferase [Dehalococcoidales bacterium]|nr:gamma-glutamylcyclotransferase [Dehalococcoidales bacterium]
MNYFAYASNLSKKQMQERCPGSKPRATAVLPNYKLVFGGWSRQWRGGTASIIRAQGGKVPGAVYEVTEECLKRLDGYEVGYHRLKVIVFDEDGNANEAVTYIRASQVEAAPPSKEYAAVIQQGYREWGIS